MFTSIFTSKEKKAEKYFEQGRLKLAKANKPGLSKIAQDQYYEAAIEDFVKAIELGIEYPQIVYYHKGMAQLKLYQQQKAIEEFDRAIEIYPNYVEAYFQRGFASYILGRYQAALGDFNRVIEDFARTIEGHFEGHSIYAEAYFYRGLARNALGCFDKAFADFNKVTQLNSEHLYAYYYRGMVCVEMGAYEEAIKDFDEALKRNPHYAEAYYHKGLTEFYLGQYRAAFKDCNSAINLRPMNAAIYVGRGLLLFLANNVDKAKQDIETVAQQLDEYDVYTLLGKAVLAKYGSKPDNKEANTLLEKVEKYFSYPEYQENIAKQISLYFFYGKIAQRLKDIKTAEEAYEKVLSLGEHAPTKQALAELKGIKTAEEPYKKVLSLGEHVPTKQALTQLKQSPYKILVAYVEKLQILLTRYQALPDKDINYYQELSARINRIHDALSTQYQQNPSLLTKKTLNQILKAFKEHQDRLTKALESYEQNDYWQQAIQHVQQDLQAPMKSPSDLYQKTLTNVLSRYKISKTQELSPDTIKHIRKEIDRQIGQQLTKEMKAIYGGQQYQEHLQQLQETLLKDISERQQQLDLEIVNLKKEQESIKDPLDMLCKRYEAKQQTLAEQLALQHPVAVQVFYNTIEKVLAASLMSAMILVSKMVKREDSKMDKVGKLTGSLVGGLCEGIPVVGGIVGSLVDFGIEEGVGAINDHFHDKKYQNTADSIISIRDAMKIAELVARRLALSYGSYIQTQQITEMQAKKAGEKAAKVVSDWLADNPLKPLAHASLDEKVKVLVQVVHERAKLEKGWLRKNGGIFSEPVAIPSQFFTATPTHPSGSSPVSSPLVSPQTRQAALQTFVQSLSSLLALKLPFEIEVTGENAIEIRLTNEAHFRASDLLADLSKELAKTLGDAVMERRSIIDNTLLLKIKLRRQVQQVVDFLRDAGIGQTAPRPTNTP